MWSLRGLLSVFWIFFLRYAVCENVTAVTVTTNSPTTVRLCGNETCAAENDTTTTTTTTTVKPVQMNDTHHHVWNMKVEKISHEKWKWRKNQLCLCDLQDRFCDVNCCCDPDCTVSNKMVFSTCDTTSWIHQNYDYDSNFCTRKRYDYKNKSLYEKETISNSLFCIVKTNLPTHYYEEHKTIIRSTFDAKREISSSKSHKWYNYDEVENGKIANFTNHLSVYGDEIMIIQNLSIFKRLEFAQHFINGKCRFGVAIKYLEDVTTKCEMQELDIENFVKNRTVLSQLRFLNTSFINKTCSSSICVPINLKICNETPICNNFTENLNNFCREKNCSSSISKIEYYFYHNGTSGVKKVDLHLTISNNTKNDYSTTRTLSATFLWFNQTERNHSDFKSGNPGYLIGKPILIGKLITRNESVVVNGTKTNETKIVQYINRPYTKYLENFLVLPRNDAGKCVLSENSFTTIEFGYNLIKKCRVVQGFASKTNATAAEICKDAQNRILSYWNLKTDPQNDTMVNISVGFYGNAKTHIISDWGPFLYETPNEKLQVNGTFLKGDNSTIECYNVSTLVVFNLFHRRERFDQEKIVAVYLQYTKTTKLRLKLIKENYLRLDVPISSQVMFYDVTEDRFLKYVDPPSLDIKLPHDFFYPFVKVGRNRADSRFGSHRTYYHALLLITFVYLV